MSEGDIDALLKRRRVEAEEADKRQLKEVERKKIWNRLEAIFTKIHRDLPNDPSNSIDCSQLSVWLVEYNERIEAYVSCLQETEFAEFLPFLQSRDDAEFFCAELLNQDSATRLKTLRSVADDLKAGRLHHWFDSFQVDGLIWRDLHRFLLSWSNWLRAESWEDRYRVYDATCREAQVAASSVNSPVDANAFKHCEEQYRRLMADPDRIESRCPIPRPWLDEKVDRPPIVDASRGTKKWREIDIVASVAAADTEDSTQENVGEIPPENRSRPLPKKEAAALYGQSVRWLSACMNEGTIQFEELSRQSFVFDVTKFPVESQKKARWR